MKDLSQQTLSKIKQQKIQPKPRWRFLLRDSLVWTLFGVSVVVGSMGFSATLYLISTSDWDIHGQLGRGFTEHIMVSLPYLWLAIIIGFVFLAFYNFRHTQRGYRYRTGIILMVSVVVSLAGGTIIFLAGGGGPLDRAMGHGLPFYKAIQEKKEEIWCQPEKGLLVGQITAVSEQGFYIADCADQKWQIEYSPEMVMGPLELEDGMKVKVIGQIVDDTTFAAQRIRPWAPGEDLPLPKPPKSKPLGGKARPGPSGLHMKPAL